MDEWKARRAEIEDELKRVWVKTEGGSGELDGPGYLGGGGEDEEREAEHEEEELEDKSEHVSQESADAG